ncbi:MAG: gamma-butyrobetaine hydroxylase-like domain-containing protein [Anaerolineales bacterium]
MKPVSITANREKKEFTVTWDDNHVSLYPFSLLRAGCPCAECRGGHDKMGDTPDPSVFFWEMSDSPVTRITNVLPVGSYGITPVWEDGHDAGIYKWDYLRALCPCGECRK